MPRFIFSFAGVAIAAAVFFWFTAPTYSAVQKLQSQIGQYDEALTKAQELQQLKQTLLSKYNSFSASDLDRLQKMLPDQVDNIALILDLDSLASTHGMLLENVDVNNLAPPSGAPSQTASTIGAGGSKYNSITLHFTVHNTYAEFERFMNDLETSLRVVDLVSLSIKPGGPGTSNTSRRDVYQYNITLRTYWLK